MSPAETTITMVVAVGVIGLLMKWFTRDEKTTTPSEPGDQVESLLAEVSDDESDAEGDIVAITSDGWAFVPDGHAVQLIPPESDAGDVPVRSAHMTGNAPQTDPETQVMGGRGGPVNPRTHHPVSSWKPGQHINAGDLVGARVKRGAPDLDPWRLEAVGRDGDYRAWFFETEEAARAAHDLLERRVVRPAKDEDGEPVKLTGADFDAARHLDEETERALDAGEE